MSASLERAPDQIEVQHPLGFGLHAAAIMDGNGRWATRRRLPRIAGHAAGEAAVMAIVDGAIAEKLAWLTLFAFSTENWNRPPAEVEFLMESNRRLILKHGPSYHARNIRVRYLGEPDRVPERVLNEMRKVEAVTAANTGLNLTFAFNHGGRSEIAAAASSLIASGCNADLVDEQLFAKHLPLAEMPDPDLVIRTSGECRISNFLLWRVAYAELIFLPIYWPDFRAEHLRAALATYHSRTRRFGRIENEPPEVAPAAAGSLR